MTEGLGARAIVFFSLLSVPIIVWALIVVPTYLADADWPGLVVWGIANAFPLVKKDIGLTGELTPAIAAAAILALAPQSDFTKNAAAAGLALLTYVLYLQMTLFFSTNSGMSLIRSNIPADHVSDAKAAVLALISSIRTSSLFIFCSIIGLNAKPIKESIVGRVKK